VVDREKLGRIRAASLNGYKPHFRQEDPEPLTDQDLERSSVEWIGVIETHRKSGSRAGMLAEAAWAAEWAERFIAEVRRLQIEAMERRKRLRRAAAERRKKALSADGNG
jgi:hypothetical protein